VHPARDNGRTRPDTPDIPCRRGLLTTSAAALLAGVAIALPAANRAPQPAVDDDAELVRLADEIMAI
jgi:hypothetical protein